MARTSKKLVEAYKNIEVGKLYPLSEAIALAQKTSYSKFDGSIDLAIKLNLDVKKAEQQLRGSISLPHGLGKKVKVLVASEDLTAQEEAKQAGADIVVGKEDLTEILQKEKFDFDIMVADPSLMPLLGRFGKALGPKGLMPNPKLGTITTSPGKVVKEIKKGKANYRTDKNGIIHASIGKVSFSQEQLVENAITLINTIRNLRPASVKGNYFQTINISASIGPAIKVKIEI